jgi:murein DD-endopeptidase MepM/ murein hydrolase activator NlpD
VRRGHFEVTVPVRARSGRVDVLSAYGDRVTVPRRIRIRPPVLAPKLAPAATFFAGATEKPKLSFEASAAAPVAVEAVRADDGTVVRGWSVNATPGSNTTTWDGQTDTGPAANGRYFLRLGATGASVSGASSSAPFGFFDHIFPTRGRHDLGQSATNNFGGGRNHRGQDLFARCGTPLAAARGGTVRFAGFNARAGNYAVISSPATGQDYVYMHMQGPSLVQGGDSIATGQPLGAVGDSGNASGCHLHFELWSAPGWYAGGEARDPLPALRAWDGWS